MKGASPSIHTRNKPLIAKLVDELFIRSWWVIVFVALTFCIFNPILKHLESGENKLRDSLSSLQLEKQATLNQKHHLELQLDSQEDPFWVEMILKKELGLVSEGQTKVHFITN